jgi:hypothetical protein
MQGHQTLVAFVPGTILESFLDAVQNPNNVFLKVQTGKSSIELIKEGKL